MSIKCNKCGKECRIGTEQVGVDSKGLPIIHRFSYCDSCMTKNDLDLNLKKKESGFGIAGLICSVLTASGIFAIVSLVLCLIGLTRKDKKSVCGIIGLCLCFTILFINVDWFSDTTETNTYVSETIKESDSVEIVENKKDVPVAENIVEYEINQETGEKVELNNIPPETEPQESEFDYRASCMEYKYKDVLRNPSDYVGQRVKVTVRISSVHEDSWMNDGKYYFAYSESEYGWLGDRYGIFDRRAEQSPKLLEDDIITVYGEIVDPEYTSSLIVNGSETFCIDMKYIDFISE